MKKGLLFLVLCMVCVFQGVPAFGARPDYASQYELEYNIYDLGTVAGGSTKAYGVNNSATVTGDVTSRTGSKSGFVYSNEAMVKIDAGNGTFTSARAINDAGQVTGYTTNGSAEAFIYEKGALEGLGTLGGRSSYAQGMNNWGMVVGYSDTKSGETHAFVYDGISMQDVGTLGGNFSIAKDISDLGGVVGYASTEEGYDHAFIYGAGTGHMEDIGTLGGDNSYGYSINRFGHAVGYAETEEGNNQAFYYDGETMLGLGTLGGDESYAFSINEFGFVVGSAETNGGESHAYIYHENDFWYYGTTIIDLNDFVDEDSGWECLTAAYDVNEWGQIVGTGIVDGELHAFLMSPFDIDVSEVPLPGSSILLGSCVSLFIASRRRRV